MTTEASRTLTRPLPLPWAPPRARRTLRRACRAKPARPALLGLVAMLALTAGTPRPAAAADFIVVVNAANPQTALPTGEVSNMFLQKTHKWESGERVKAVDLTEASPARESFSKAIHGRSTAAVKAYWQRMIFSGIDAPPPEKASAADVLAFVRANAGAIGYVPAGTQLPDGVKVLRVTP